MSKIGLFFNIPFVFRLLGFSLVCLLIGFVLVADNQSVSSAGKDSPPAQRGIRGSKTEERKNPHVLLSIMPSPTPEISHTLVGSYYSVENNLDAKLLLNNKGNTQLEVRPTLYSKLGQELQLPAVLVEPQSFRFINLRDWATLGGDGFETGNIKLFHYGKDLVLGAQIYLTDESHHISFEEKLTELGKFDSRRQEAVAVIPGGQTGIRVVLTNTADIPLSLTATPSRSPNIIGNPHVFQLAAHETKAIDLRQDFGDQFADAEVFGLSVEHAGAKDALLSRVLIANMAKGYSNAVQFSNPAGGQSREYQGVGFQIEDIGGHQLIPVVVARNVGTDAATVITRIAYTRVDGTRGTIILPQKTLSGGQMGLIDTRSIAARVQQEQIKVASLEVAYNTAPGSVIVAAHSVSTDGDQVFRVPMWDPLAQRSPTGGYPWRIEGTSTTQAYIKNITDVEEDYVAFLLWENGGMYMIGLKPIGPHETVNIDVKKLRDEQVPDERGRTIPLYVSSGQLQWTLRRKDSLPDDDSWANLSLIGRSEQVDTTNGIVSNYSCQNCCVGSHLYGFIIPTSTEIDFGETAHFIAVEGEATCYDLPYEFNVTANWTSSDPNIGSISGGNITGQAVGQTNIGASWTTHSAFAEPCPPGGEDPPPFSQIAYNQDTTCNRDGERRGGPNASEAESTSTIVAPLLRPPCGTCQFHSFIFIPPVATLTVIPAIQKIQYQDPGTSNYVDITSTLYVLKGTNVNFRAIPNPPGSTFPSGQPVWSGTSGATGAGPNIVVSFNTVSSSLSDLKTVIASSGTPTFVNVIVYELTPEVTPEDNYVPIFPQVARSLTEFGLKEVVGFSFLAHPAVTASQAGGLQWSVQTGTGTIPTPARTDGIGIFTAPASAESSILKLEVLSGPSKGGNIVYNISIIAPNDGYLVKTSNIERTVGDFGGSFHADFYLEPRNVSFYNLYFSEGAAVPSTNGYLAYFSAFPHMASPSPAAINRCIPSIGCNKIAGTDTITTRTTPANPPISGYVGEANWPIPWLYHTNLPSTGTEFTIANHFCSSNNVGTASLEKKGAGPFSVAITDPTSTY
jgi:hypothetical protein